MAELTNGSDYVDDADRTQDASDDCWEDSNATFGLQNGELLVRFFLLRAGFLHRELNGVRADRRASIRDYTIQRFGHQIYWRCCAR